MANRKMKILAIDDNQDNLITLKALLKDIFPEVLALTASSGQEGLELAAAEDPDVILLDIVMPGMDGFEMCRKLKADGKLCDIPVIFITALKGHKDSRIRALECGAEAFLSKPVDEIELTAQIRAMMKIRNANIEKRNEKGRLSSLLESQNLELIKTNLAALNLLEDLRKENEERKKSEDRLIKLAEQSRTVTWEVDSHGLYTYLSEMCEKVFGYSPDEMIGRMHFYDLHPESGREEFKKAAFAVFAQKGKFHNLENPGETKDGRQLWLSSNGIPILNADGTLFGYRGADIDITVLKHAETEKDELESLLRQSQKMEAVGQLAGGISHDFNNLLSIINGYSQMLLDDKLLKESQRSKLEEIMRAGDLATSLTRQLLVFSRRQSMESRIIDLNETVSVMNKMLRRIIMENIKMVIELQPHLWHVKVDPGQIEQLIMNLLVNARDAMPEGGKLTIKTENVVIDGSARHAHPAGVKPGSYVMLSVSDTGCGMDDNVKQHIFEPFFTTKETGKGTGLGLAIVYGVVKQCNAFIDVQSELGKGTLFRIYFPQVADESSSPEAVSKSMGIPGGSETILLVEDGEVLRALLGEFLRSIGYVVLQSGNGIEALENAEKHEGPIHLLLTDIVMPEMSGFELAKKIRKSMPDIKMIFMTGHAKPFDTHGMIRINNNLMQKPVSIYALAFKLREVLGA